MAFYDDRKFLLSHINHSFITNDDTGICEVVMLDQEVFENQHKHCLKLIGENPNADPSERLAPSAYDLPYESELRDSEIAQSYDVASELDLVCHRRRSNTAQRLERLRKERDFQSKTRHIVWRSGHPTASRSMDHLNQDPQEAEETFVKVEESDRKALARANIIDKSPLTKILEKHPYLPKNPFAGYDKFDSRMCEPGLSMNIRIYIAIDPDKQRHPLNNPDQQPSATTSRKNNRNVHYDDYVEEEFLTKNVDEEFAGLKVEVENGDANATSIEQSPYRMPRTRLKPNNQPIDVEVTSTARVEDLIGLICYLYTNERREPRLHPDVNKYSLKIAEDNGGVEADFPPLCRKDPLSKFSFPKLAFTDAAEEKSSDNTSERTYHPSYIPESTYNQDIITQLPSKSKNGKKTFFSMITSKTLNLTRVIFRDATLEPTQSSNLF